MTLKECTALLAPLAVLLQTDVDAPTYRAYYRALEDVPLLLLQAAVERAGKSATFFPKPGELRTFAEDARQATLQAHPFLSCGACSAQGWVEYEIDCVKRHARCRCWTAHHERIKALGVGSAPLALPAPREIVDA